MQYRGGSGNGVKGSKKRGDRERLETVGDVKGVFFPVT